MGTVRDFLLGMKEGFGNFGMGVASIVNFILLSFVYVFGVGLTFAVARLKGKHFLEMKIDRKRKSYYIENVMKKEETEEYYRQF